MTTFARRFSLGGPDQFVPPASSGSALPGQLMIQPGVYTWNGSAFDMTAAGLYILATPLIGAAYRIVKGNPVDVVEIMRGLCWLTMFGNLNNGQTNPTRTQTATTRRLAMLCDDTAKWCQYILAYNGIQSRVVRVLTAETPNGSDDGHVMLEVLVDGSWVLFDVSYDRSWESRSFSDVMANGVASCTETQLAQGEASHVYNNPNGNNHPYFAYYDTHLRMPADRAIWTNRIIQIPGIDHTDGLTYFYMPPGTESRQAWLLSLSTAWRVTSYANWLSMFYL